MVISIRGSGTRDRRWVREWPPGKKEIDMRECG